MNLMLVSDTMKAVYGKQYLIFDVFFCNPEEGAIRYKYVGLYFTIHPELLAISPSSRQLTTLNGPSLCLAKHLTT